MPVKISDDQDESLLTAGYSREHINIIADDARWPKIVDSILDMTQDFEELGFSRSKIVQTATSVDSVAEFTQAYKQAVKDRLAEVKAKIAQCSPIQRAMVVAAAVVRDIRDIFSGGRGTGGE
jgi:hypothetical protein